MPRHFDLLINGATIIDGSGEARYRGNLGVSGERIAAVGDVRGTAERVIDGAGLVLAPGFVEPHSHGDLNILQYPLAENYVMQGITTFVGGHCGMSRAPLTAPWYAGRWMYMFGPEVEGVEPNWKTMADFMRRVQDAQPSVNYAPLVGSGALRLAVMGQSFCRSARSGEAREMEGHLREAMESGAFGMSAGMDYEGDYADPETEVSPLCKVVAEYDGVYCPHHRNNSTTWPVRSRKDFGFGRSHFWPEDPFVGRYHGLIEAVDVARDSGVRLIISHLPPMYWIPQPHPREMDEAIARATLDIAVDKPRAEGLDVRFSVFACPASGGTRASILNALYSRLLKPPAWLGDLSRAELVEKLKSRKFRDRIRHLASTGLYRLGPASARVDPYWMDVLRIATCTIKEYEGKTIGEIARSRQPRWTSKMVYLESFETVFDIVVADPNATWDVIIDKREPMPFLEIAVQHPLAMPLFDGICVPAVLQPGVSGIPPVWYGMYPYHIDTFVKKQSTISLEHAIRQMSAVPCEAYRVQDRGTIREGAFADLVLFDLERIRMTGTFAKPDVPPEGMVAVTVNGRLVMDEGRLTYARPGKVLQRT